MKLLSVYRWFLRFDVQQTIASIVENNLKRGRGHARKKKHLADVCVWNF